MRFRSRSAWASFLLPVNDCGERRWCRRNRERWSGSGVVQSPSELADSNVGGPTITAYPDFKNVCSAFVVGYRRVSGPQLFPKWGNFAGECRDKAIPFVFSLTHENDKNNHKGSANFDPNIVAYMGDLNVATDLGRWVEAAFGRTAPARC